MLYKVIKWVWGWVHDTLGNLPLVYVTEFGSNLLVLAYNEPVPISATIYLYYEKIDLFISFLHFCHAVFYSALSQEEESISSFSRKDSIDLIVISYFFVPFLILLDSLWNPNLETTGEAGMFLSSMTA